MPSPAVVFLMGATATGKTDLSLEIAKRFAVEIVSVDSAMIYRGMNIGTAKPNAAILASTPHHLVDIIDPAERYSVWDFGQQSRELIRQANARGKLVLMVGGSMMYFHAFEAGLNGLPEADLGLRQRISQQAEDLGWEAMHAKLKEIDAVSAGRIKAADSQRIQRALEVFEITGEPLSVLQQQKANGYQGHIEKIILAANDRAKLHQRIEQRFQQMLKMGFLEEVASLKVRDDLDLSLPSMRCVGYRQAWQHLDAELSHQQMFDKAVAATRQLAKRQLTWLRKQPESAVFDCLNYSKDAIFHRIESVLSRV